MGIIIPNPIRSTKIVKRIIGSGLFEILCLSIKIKYNKKNHLFEKVIIGLSPNVVL